MASTSVVNPKSVPNSYYDKFLELCTKGNLDEIKKMYYGKSIIQKIKSMIYIRKKKNTKIIVTNICRSGNIEALNWYKSLYPDIKLYQHDFISAVASNNPEFVKYIYNMDKNIINYDISHIKIDRNNEQQVNYVNDLIKLNKVTFELSVSVLLMGSILKKNEPMLDFLCSVFDKYYIDKSNPDKFQLKIKDYKYMIDNDKFPIQLVKEISECPICFETKNINLKLNCNHSFCNECMNKIYEDITMDNKCSLCRCDVDNEKIILMKKID